MAKSETRVCRYVHCLHNTKDIDLVNEQFVKDGNMYYHEDCYKTKNDIQRIKTLWHDNIDRMVVFAQLNKILNNLIFKDHISSDYILFAVKYAIDNKDVKLQYPPGLKYVLGNQKVKAAYEKAKAPKYTQSDFVAKEDDSNAPKFSFKKKNTGFGSILGGNS